VKEMRAAGHTVLFITHNIHHVFQVSDRVIVMRHGEVVAERDAADTNLLEVEALIMGVDPSRLAEEAKVH
jgi:simple sugar transport system ATP-binding protein